MRSIHMHIDYQHFYKLESHRTDVDPEGDIGVSDALKAQYGDKNLHGSQS